MVIFAPMPKPLRKSPVSLHRGRALRRTCNHRVPLYRYLQGLILQQTQDYQQLSELYEVERVLCDIYTTET